MSQRLLELGMRERCPKVRNRLPQGIVQEHRAADDSLMQLGSDVSRLLLHPVCVRLPGRQQSRNVFLRDLEQIDQYNWRYLGTDLLKDRDALVKGFELKHGGSPSGGCG